MPKPRALRKEERRLARRNAREAMATALRHLATGADAVPPDARAAFLDEINRTLAFVLRTRVHRHCPTAALSDRPGTEGELEPER